MTEQRGDGVSRRAIMGAAWAAPVVVLAVAAPAVAASGGDIVLTWSSNPALFGTPVTLIVEIPVSSPYVGQLGYLSLLPVSGDADITTVAAAWPGFFTEPIIFQSYVPPTGEIEAGSFVFQMRFADSGRGAVYQADVRDFSGTTWAASPLLTFTT